MSSTYHKREINRVMTWTQNDKYKFQQLEHFFRLYFKAKKKEEKK